MKEHSQIHLNWEGVPGTVTELNSFKKQIKKFKSQKAINIINSYRRSYNHNGKTYFRYKPQIENTNERRNVGIFTTALCLDVISQYASETNIAKDFTEDWKKYFEFIIYGLSGEFNNFSGSLSIITTMNKLFSFLKNELSSTRNGNILDRNCDSFSIDKIDEIKNEADLYNKYYDLITRSFIDIHNNISTIRESLHPFFLYKSLVFIDNFKVDIVKALEKNSKNKRLKRKYKIDRIPDETISRALGDAKGDELLEMYFDNIYFLSKYEMYRQMALNLSGDLTLYDVKRLIYSLLVVSYNDRFSNNLIAAKVLKMIFSTQHDNPNQLWPTGQLIPVSLNALMSISSIECACDLLDSRYISLRLHNFFTEIKAIYDFHARSIQLRKDHDNDDAEIIGWYPPHFRDKTPLGYITAFTLFFIKKFCELVSIKIKSLAKDYFKVYYRSPNMEWKDICDSLSAKSKLVLLDKNADKNNTRHMSSAILFGPPGTGKTSYARALSNLLNWDYLELTPNVFFSGNQQSIVENINNIFENMLHLEKTVVFIDEIDDLIRSRKGLSTKRYELGNMYVNILLPRFQELHDKGDIILILATNHYEDVDDAISRPGRIDLMIPVGHLSPHARLSLIFKYFNEELSNAKYANYKEFIGRYLAATKYVTYGYLDTSLKELRNSRFIEHDTLLVQAIDNIFSNSNDKLLKKFARSLSGDGDTKFPNIRPNCDQDRHELEDDMDEFIQFSRYLFSTNKNLRPKFSLINTFLKKCNKKEYLNIITPFYDQLLALYANHPKGVTDIQSTLDDLANKIYARTIK